MDLGSVALMTVHLYDETGGVLLIGALISGDRFRVVRRASPVGPAPMVGFLFITIAVDR